MPEPKILVLDIETRPALADVWGLWNENIPLPRLREATKMLCFAAKWLGKDWAIFYSQWNNGSDMVRKAWELLDDADVVIHFNGKRFDIPHLNREIAMAGFDPPSPYQQIDLYQVVKSTFKFDSNKLAHVADQFGLTGKAEHEGYEMWLKVMNGDPAAQQAMEVYNIQDVEVTEALYRKVRPWIRSHPNLGLFVDVARPVCPRCQGMRLQKRGTYETGMRMYQRFRCKDCGGWTKGSRAVNAVGQRSIA